jgi:CRP-like cAMP-binding protein
MNHQATHETSLQNMVSRLGTVSFFKHMGESDLKDIVLAGQVRNFQADSTLFRESEHPAGLHVIVRGQVNLYRVGLQGIEYIIHILKPVTMFNEITVIDRLPNPVTAVAVVDSMTWQLSPEGYQSLVPRYPAVGYGLLYMLAKRNRLLLTHYEDLMSRPVLARTAKLLHALSKGGQQIVNRYDHPNRRIAAMAATVPEAISRSLRILKENDVIECTRSQIKIVSVETLTQYALVEPTLLKYESTG